MSAPACAGSEDASAAQSGSRVGSTASSLKVADDVAVAVGVPLAALPDVGAPSAGTDGVGKDPVVVPVGVRLSTVGVILTAVGVAVAVGVRVLSSPVSAVGRGVDVAFPSSSGVFVAGLGDGVLKAGGLAVWVGDGVDVRVAVGEAVGVAVTVPETGTVAETGPWTATYPESSRTSSR